MRGRGVKEQMYWKPYLGTLFHDKVIGGSVDVRKEGKTGSYRYHRNTLIG
jgi:hypothetical protein